MRGVFTSVGRLYITLINGFALVGTWPSSDEERRAKLLVHMQFWISVILVLPCICFFLIGYTIGGIILAALLSSAFTMNCVLWWLHSIPVALHYLFALYHIGSAGLIFTSGGYASPINLNLLLRPMAAMAVYSWHGFIWLGIVLTDLTLQAITRVEGFPMLDLTPAGYRFFLFITLISILLLAFVIVLASDQAMYSALQKETLGDIRKSNASLVASYFQVESAAQAKARFVSLVSRELTPVKQLASLTKRLRQTSLTDEQSEFVKPMYTAAKQMMKLIEHVTDHTQLSSNAVLLCPVHFSVSVLLSDCMLLCLVAVQVPLSLLVWLL